MRFFGEPTRELEVAGVTGTNGKTTTAFLLRSILDAAGHRPGLVGTVEWIVGASTRPAPHTTPEAIDLQRLFREMLDAGDRSVAIEASSHGSALRRLDRVRFDALVFTNLAQDHLDLHGTMEDYYQAKRRLFTGAQPPPAAVNVGRRARPQARDRARRDAPCAAHHVRDHRRRRGAARGPRDRRGRQPLHCGGHRDRDAAARVASTSRTCSARSRPASSSTSTTTRSPPAFATCRASRAGSRRSTRASRSPSSSTTRTRRTRSTSCCRRPASSAPDG